MPSWRDTLKGQRAGSIPPPTPPDPGAAGSGLVAIVSLGGNYGNTVPLSQAGAPPDSLTDPQGQAVLFWDSGGPGNPLVNPVVAAPLYDPAKTLFADVLLQVFNLAGTESFSVDTPSSLALAPGQRWEPTAESDWEVGPQVGSDLSLTPEGAVATAAGGKFLLVLSARFTLEPW